MQFGIESNQLVVSENSHEGTRTRQHSLSVESLDAIACEYGILVGKWLVFRSRKEIDEMWTQIALSTQENKLGIQAKVSTATGNEKHVICVYTADYLCKEDVLRVREELRRLGITEELYYKPDIYTHFGIYSGTTPLRPWCYKG